MCCPLADDEIVLAQGVGYAVVFGFFGVGNEVVKAVLFGDEFADVVAELLLLVGVEVAFVEGFLPTCGIGLKQAADFGLAFGAADVVDKEVVVAHGFPYVFVVVFIMRDDKFF